MNKIFLDTNFIIDYFIREDYRDESERLLTIGIRNGCRFFISFLSVANFAYIMRKLPEEKLYSLLDKVCELFEVVPNDSSQINKAIRLHAHDFEDALQYQSALDAGCECIITRNAKDFCFSNIPVCSASECVSQYLRIFK